MKTIKTNSFFLDSVIRVVEAKVTSTEFDNRLPDKSLLKSIYDYKHLAKSKDLPEKIFGNHHPNRDYFSKRQSEARGSKQYTDFNIDVLINILSFIDIPLPITKKGEQKTPVQKIVMMANDFIKEHLPGVEPIPVDADEILPINSQKLDLIKYQGHAKQGECTDTCKFSYYLNENGDPIGTWLVSYEADGERDIYDSNMATSGKIINNQFMLLIYYKETNPEEQCGTLFLEFSNDCKTLKGEYMGYYKKRPKLRGECKGEVILTIDNQ